MACSKWRRFTNDTKNEDGDSELLRPSAVFCVTSLICLIVFPPLCMFFALFCLRLPLIPNCSTSVAEFSCVLHLLIPDFHFIRKASQNTLFFSFFNNFGQLTQMPLICIQLSDYEWLGAGVVICLERGADLHMAQLMPLPLTVSCFSKIQIGFTFLVPAHPGGPGQRAVKHVCV